MVDECAPHLRVAALGAIGARSRERMTELVERAFDVTELEAIVKRAVEHDGDSVKPVRMRFSEPKMTLEHSMLARVIAGRFAYRARDVRGSVDERDAEPFRVTVELAAAFRAEALERGADEALVVLLASEREIEPLARDGEHFWSPLAAAISARGVPVVDPGAALAELWRSTEGAGFSAGVHLGPEANAVVARELWSWFLARDFATELTPDHEQEPR